MDSLRTHLLL